MGDTSRNPDMTVRIVGTGDNPDASVAIVGDQTVDLTGASEGDVIQVDAGGGLIAGSAPSGATVPLPADAPSVGDVLTVQDDAPLVTEWSAPSGASVAGYPPSVAANPYAQGSLVGDGVIASSGDGSFAQGYANDSTITSSGTGSSAQGYAYASDGVATIISSDYGTFAQGYARGNDAGVATIESSGSGSFAQGYVYTSLVAGVGTIVSSGSGSFAQGYVDNDAGVGTIESSGTGSFAQGSALTSADDATIVSSGSGSFAQGYVVAGETITASAANAAQFGPGTNAQADSLQVGSAGIRLLGKVGAAAVPQNGDIYVDGTGNVVIQSGGVPVTIA